MHLRLLGVLIVLLETWMPRVGIWICLEKEAPLEGGFEGMGSDLSGGCVVAVVHVEVNDFLHEGLPGGRMGGRRGGRRRYG